MRLEDALPVLFFCAAPVLVIGIAFVANQIQRRRITENWRMLASRTGLVMEPGSFMTMPSISGTFQGRPARVYTYTVSHGRSSTRYTAASLQVKNPGSLVFEVRRENLFDSIGKALGAQDVQIGVEDFDRQFLIKSQPESLARDLLGMDSNLRSIIAAIPNVNITYGGSTILYKQTGLNTDADLLYRIFDTLSHVADAIEGGAREETPKEGFEEEPPEKDKEFQNDPFYQKKTPAASYPDPYQKQPISPQAYDPFAPPKSTVNVRLYVIAAVIAIDLAITAAVLVYFLMKR